MKPRNNEIDPDQDLPDEQDDAGELDKTQAPDRQWQQQQGDGIRRNRPGSGADGTADDDGDIEGRGGKANVHPDDDGADETDDETAADKRS